LSTAVTLTGYDQLCRAGQCTMW